MNREGSVVEYFEDSGGQRRAGTAIYRETPNSYEIIIDIQRGRQPQKAYFKLAETNRSDRIALRARFEDLRTQEKLSIDGELVIGVARGRQDDDFDWEDEFDWDEEEWWEDFGWDWWDEEWTDEDDFFLGDEYFGEGDDFFGDEEFFFWEDDEDFDYGDDWTGYEAYDDIGDFEITRFEGAVEYSGCNSQLAIREVVIDFRTGRLTGTISLNNETGSVDYNFNTGQGQIVLNTARGQVRIVFNGDVVEALYPDGRRERVNLSQWTNPCEGVDSNQGGGGNQGGGNQGGGNQPTQLALSSGAFPNGGFIPLRHAYTDVGGQNRSPALSWTGAPSGTRSFALVCIDIDAEDFVHWVVYDIPASVTSLPEGIPIGAELTSPVRLKQGLNEGDNRAGYFGPAPPAQDPAHRYKFILYALSVDTLGLPGGATYQQVRQAIQGKVLAQAEIIGRFKAER